MCVQFRIKLDYAAAALGFFVPYLDLDVILLPTPPCTSLAKLTCVLRHTYQIQCASDQVVLHTGAILRTASSHHNDRMLLHVVTCALVSRLCSQPHTWLRRTFTGNVGGDDLPCAQTHPGNLALARVGLLGLGCADLQAHALQLRPVPQLRRSQLSCPLLYPTLSQHLDQCALVGS
jgi:hypothetical protein